MRTAGFVLVGGMSTRMGQDKALLPWRSRPLVEKIAAMVAAAAGSVTLVGRPERYGDLGISCLPDRRDQLGPLAGIEAALESMQAEWNLIAACDMPGLDSGALHCLLDKAVQTNASCVAARDVTGQIHPLCAVYHSRCLPLIKRALEEGRLKLMKVLEELGAEYVPVQTELANINTPEEWLRWRQFS